MSEVETAVPRREIVKEKSVTMEYFLETSHLDKQTAELLRQYDKDGDGSFSKDEVVAIILDLREAMQSNEVLYSSNKLFKRLLTAAVAFCVLLLTSMFGLSYAVAVLTAKTDVRSDGTLVASDSGAIVATDSRAYVIPVNADESGIMCFSQEEKNVIMEDVFSGKNVILQDNDGSGQQTMQQLKADGATVINNQPCFLVSSDGTIYNWLCFLDGIEECAGRRQRQLVEEEGVSHRLLAKPTNAPTFPPTPAPAPTATPTGGTAATSLTCAEGDTTCGAQGGPCCRRFLSEGFSLREIRESGY